MRCSSPTAPPCGPARHPGGKPRHERDAARSARAVRRACGRRPNTSASSPPHRPRSTSRITWRGSSRPSTRSAADARAGTSVTSSDRARGAQLQSRRPPCACGPLRAGGGVRRRGVRPVGQLEDDAFARDKTNWPFLRSGRSTSSTTRASTSPSKARSMSTARRKDARGVPGRPVEPARNLAARSADVVFTVQQDIAERETLRRHQARARSASAGPGMPSGSCRASCRWSAARSRRRTTSMAACKG